MISPQESGRQEFDAYASNYDDALAQGLSVSGETKEYFAQCRVSWLAKCLRELGMQPREILDFGCGTGSSAPFLLNLNQDCRLTGLEVSPNSLEIARKQHGSSHTQFLLVKDYRMAGSVDVAFCNGVFHHIPLHERADAIALIFRAIRRGGLFAFWENNPWNPGTRYVMSRIPFDRDAIKLSPREARRLLRAGGFDVLRTDFLFYFPRVLRLLRGLERLLVRLPLGAQYQVLCRKP